MEIESLVVEGLLSSEIYARKVVSHVLPEFFREKKNQIIVEKFRGFFLKYDSVPTTEVMEAECSVCAGISADLNAEVEDVLRKKSENEIQVQWLVDKTEKFCRDRAVYNAILESLQIIEGTDTKLTEDAIPGILQKALQVEFNPRIGTSYSDDAEERFNAYTEKTDKLPFDLDILNKITDGGLPKESLLLLLAMCVHPDTEVEIRLTPKS